MILEHGWVEEWEEEARTKNDCVAKAQLLVKCKGLVFCDPYSGKSISIWDQNKTWSSAVEEEMDGSWLVFLQMKVKRIMKHSHLRLHVNQLGRLHRGMEFRWYIRK